jgi:hypothetical protein
MSSCYLNFDPVKQTPLFRETLMCKKKESIKGYLRENKSAISLYADKVRQIPSIAVQHGSLKDIRSCKNS